ncbi:MAG: hypothetical protein QOF98_2107 [Streptomyces sp.]|nr:hypothetical protein [Streptomyces sp.]
MPAKRGGYAGGLVLLLVCGSVLGGLLAGAAEFGWARDRALWLGFGALLAALTLARPWWFWESYKARWLRGLIGDEPTAAFYLAMAAAMMWVGWFTTWTFGRRAP